MPYTNLFYILAYLLTFDLFLLKFAHRLLLFWDTFRPIMVFLRILLSS